MKNYKVNYDSGISPEETANQLNHISKEVEIEIVPQVTACVKYIENTPDDFEMEEEIRNFEDLLEDFKVLLKQETTMLRGLLMDKGYNVKVKLS